MFKTVFNWNIIPYWKTDDKQQSAEFQARKHALEQARKKDKQRSTKHTHKNQLTFN
jgi:hypothetical protein